MENIGYKEIKEVNTCTPHYVSNKKGFFANIRENFKAGFYSKDYINHEESKQHTTNKSYNSNAEVTNDDFGNNAKSSSSSVTTIKTPKISDETGGIIIGGIIAILLRILGLIFKRGPLYIILKKLLKK